MLRSPSHHGLRRHVAHHDTVRGAAEAPVRDQRHELPQAGAHQGGARAQHLGPAELGEISRKPMGKIGKVRENSWKPIENLGKSMVSSCRVSQQNPAIH